MSETTNNMTVATPDVPVSVKPVDRRTIEGSTPGDHRSQAAPAVLPNNPSPRDSMTQFDAPPSVTSKNGSGSAESEGTEGA